MAYDKATLGEIVYYVLCKNDTATGVNSAIRDLKRLDHEAMKTLNNIRDGFSKGQYSYNTMIQMLGNELSTSYTKASKSADGYTSAARGAASRSSFLSGVLGGLTAMFAYQLVGAIESAIFGLISFGQQLVTSAVEAAGKMEYIQIAFETLLGSSEAASTQIKKMWDFALKSPFRFDDVAEGTKMLLAYGFQAGEVEKVLRNTGDAAAALGQSSEGYQRMLYALGQVKAFGALRGQETMQLVNAGIPIWQILSEQTGLKGDALRKAVEERDISGNAALSMIFSFMEKKYGGSMERMNKTTLGQLTQMQEEVQLAMTKAGEGFNKILLPVLQQVNGFIMDRLIPTVEKLVADFETLITPDVVNGFVTLVEGGLMTIVNLADGAAKSILYVMNLYGKLLGKDTTPKELPAKDVPGTVDKNTGWSLSPDAEGRALAETKPVPKATEETKQYATAWDKTIGELSNASLQSLNLEWALRQIIEAVGTSWNNLMDLIKILYDLGIILWNIINVGGVFAAALALIATAINLIAGALGVVLRYLRVFLDAIVNSSNDLGSVLGDIFKIIMGIFAKFGFEIVKFGIKLSVDFAKIGVDVGFGFANAFIDATNWLANKIVDFCNWALDTIGSLKFTVPDWVPGVGGKTYGLDVSGDLSNGEIEKFDTTAIKEQFDRGLTEMNRILEEQFNANLKTLGWDMTLEEFAKKYKVDLSGDAEDDIDNLLNLLSNPNNFTSDLTTPVEDLKDLVSDLKDTVSGKKMESNINLYFDVHIDDAGNEEEVQNAGTILQQSVISGLWERGVITVR